MSESRTIPRIKTPPEPSPRQISTPARSTTKTNKYFIYLCSKYKLMAKEIERKFLVCGDFEPYVKQRFDIAQGYLSTDPTERLGFVFATIGGSLQSRPATMAACATNGNSKFRSTMLAICSRHARCAWSRPVASPMQAMVCTGKLMYLAVKPRTYSRRNRITGTGHHLRTPGMARRRSDR